MHIQIGTSEIRDILVIGQRFQYGSRNGDMVNTKGGNGKSLLCGYYTANQPCLSM
jgi:hypothetical protein